MLQACDKISAQVYLPEGFSQVNALFLIMFTDALGGISKWICTAECGGVRLARRQVGVQGPTVCRGPGTWHKAINDGGETMLDLARWPTTDGWWKLTATWTTRRSTSVCSTQTRFNHLHTSCPLRAKQKCWCTSSVPSQALSTVWPSDEGILGFGR